MLNVYINWVVNKGVMHISSNEISTQKLIGIGCSSYIYMLYFGAL